MIYDVNLSLTEGSTLRIYSLWLPWMYIRKPFLQNSMVSDRQQPIILFIFTAQVIAVSQTIINKRKEVEA